MPTIKERLMANSVSDASGCLVWTGYKTKKGYGAMHVNGRVHPVHRLSYEAYVGPIPDGLHIDHLCRNRACINPSHLEPVTNAENIRRGASAGSFGKLNRAKTHCPKGHPYAGDNLYLRDGGKRRACKSCVRERIRQRRITVAQSPQDAV